MAPITYDEMLRALRGGFAYLTGLPGTGKSMMVKDGSSKDYTIVDTDIYGERRDDKWHVNPQHVKRLAKAAVSCAGLCDNLEEQLGYYSMTIVLERDMSELVDEFNRRAANGNKLYAALLEKATAREILAASQTKLLRALENKQASQQVHTFNMKDYPDATKKGGE